MKESFRQAMSSLHTWVGLVFGWLLMTIFVGGTLSVFSKPITRWMQDEITPAVTAASVTDRQRAVASAVSYLGVQSPTPEQWRVALPDSEHEAVRFWTHEDWEQDKVTALVDWQTGTRIANDENTASRRVTQGGYHFIHLHYSLYGDVLGIYLVGLVTAAMLLALVSGIVVHKRIFLDIFTLRFGKGQRSWLDGHNVASVLTLPFQLMIAFSGLAIFVAAYMPAGIWFHFGGPVDGRSMLDMKGPYFAAIRFDEVPRVPVSAAAATIALADLQSLATRAEQISGRPVRWLERGVDDDGRVRWRLGVERDASVGFPGYEERVYVATDGEGSLKAEPDPTEHRAANYTWGVLAILHMVDFGGSAARWLWFLSGIAGCVMIASGLVLFSVKRRQRALQEFGRATPTVYRVIDALNVGAVAGTLLATLVYLWSNRIIPAQLPMRGELEVRSFLIAWAIAPIHAFWRRERAWTEQLAFASALCLLLPALNVITTGHWLGAYLARGDWSNAAVELVAAAFGAVLLFTARKSAKRAGV